MPSTEDAVHRYSVSVTTGAWANSGTSANVSMILHGIESSSGVIELKTDQQESESTFSRGNTDKFFLAVDKQLGHLQKIRIGHDSSGECPSWFLNSISITEIETNSRWIFPCYRWLALEKDDGNTTLELFALNAKKGRDFQSELTMLGYVALQTTTFGSLLLLKSLGIRLLVCNERLAVGFFCSWEC